MCAHYHVHIATVGIEKDGPITKILNAIDGIDKLYLLYTDNEGLEKGGYIEDRVRTENEDGSTNNMVESGSMNSPDDGNRPSSDKNTYTKSKSRLLAEKIETNYEHSIGSINLRRIPMFDFLGIVQTVFHIYEEERGPKVEFSVNITGGTNLMAAALCYVSYYIDAKIYYTGNQKAPIKDQVKAVDCPKAIDIDKLAPLTKEFLKIIYDKSMKNESVSISEVCVMTGKDIKKQRAAYHKRQLVKLGLIEETKYIVKKRIDGEDVESVNKSKIGLKVTMTGAMIGSYLK